MALSTVVNKALGLAFKGLDDLARVAVFSEKNASFNFNTNTASLVDGATLTIKCIVSAPKTKRIPKTGLNTIQCTITFPSSAVPDIEPFDKVALDGYDWSPVGNFTDNGFIKELTISRSA
jgi:hypothetical protein